MEDSKVLQEKLEESHTKEEVQAAAQRVLRIAPSKRRILDMTDKMLLENYALIAHKASSLSSAQRKLLVNRVGYALNQKRISVDEVTTAVNNLTKLIEQELNDELQDIDRDAVNEGELPGQVEDNTDDGKE